MDITRENFTSVYDDLIELINTADTIAIDLEMSGIIPERPDTPLDSLDDSYGLKRSVAMRYSIIQVGLCTFHEVKNSSSTNDDVKKHYEARPFNIFVFPYATSSMYGSERRAQDVALSPNAIAFLRQHGMDFQKWIYRGVPYVDKLGEEDLQKRFEETTKRLPKDDPSLVQNTEDAMSTLNEDEKKWVLECLEKAKTLDQAEAATDASKEITLDLPLIKSKSACTALKCQVLQNALNNITVKTKGRGQEKDATLVRVDYAEQLRKANLALTDRLGFRRIYNALVAAKKPLIAHNSFSDWLFFLAKFDGPLTESLPEFKKLLTESFPTIYDTKHIVNQPEAVAGAIPNNRFDNTSLGGLFESYGLDSPRVKISLPLGFQNYTTESLAKMKANLGGSAAHEAGFDAMMTGAVFYNLKQEFPSLVPSAENKLAVFRSLYAADLKDMTKDLYLPPGDLLLTKHPWLNSKSLVDSLIQSFAPVQQTYVLAEGEALTILEHPSRQKKASSESSTDKKEEEAVQKDKKGSEEEAKKDLKPIYTGDEIVAKVAEYAVLQKAKEAEKQVADATLKAAAKSVEVLASRVTMTKMQPPHLSSTVQWTPPAAQCMDEKLSMAATAGAAAAKAAGNMATQAVKQALKK